MREGEYGADMRRMFELLSAWSADGGAAGGGGGRKVAVVREVTAQHFPGSGSYETWEQGHPASPDECRCEALPEALRQANPVALQNRLLRSLAAENPTVGLMEAYELTAGRWGMHVEGSCDVRSGQWKCYCDCTHFCYTPQLWRHNFDALARAAERSLRSGGRAAVGGVVVAAHRR